MLTIIQQILKCHWQKKTVDTGIRGKVCIYPKLWQGTYLLIVTRILDLKSDDGSKFPFCHVDGFDELSELTWTSTDLLNKHLLSNYYITVILPSFGVKMGLEELGQ